MKISIIIVNYNVRYFLEQCLISVEKAIHRIQNDGEVWVVDNNSMDDSVQLVREKFPWVKVIANKENTGFSKANNQAMRLAQGEYVLLLNPDTVIEEDTLEKIIRFMDDHPDAGGLGVKMVDGKGKFLPESKRGLPTPATSFYKIFGISKLLPHSQKFNRYHLGHLDLNKTHEIEILSGAFMMMRKSALNQVGLLDEAFFMYGEDIDLSWRIIQGGWKNYYYPETRIIHYKGESTKKGSLNYVFVFYNAMVIFAKKHFSETNAKTFGLLIQVAIWLRATLAVINRFLNRVSPLFLDFCFVITGLFVTKELYASFQHKVFQEELILPSFLVFSFVWLLSAWLGGSYDRVRKFPSSLRFTVIGSLIILLFYSLLPESMRFSRAVVLISCVLAPIWLLVSHTLLNYITSGSSGWSNKKNKNYLLIGSEEETRRVRSIIEQTLLHSGEIITRIPEQVLKENVQELVRVLKIESIVFCAKDVSAKAIIETMSSADQLNIEFKIAPPETLYIIGSNSIETTGDVHMLDINSIDKPLNRRLKRFFDVTTSIMLLILSPVLIFIQRKPIDFFLNILKVLLNSKTWVGYFYSADGTIPSGLPKMKKSVLHPLIHFNESSVTDELKEKFNLVYAKDYSVLNDLKIVRKGIRLLGN